jgi:hypothetical protein
MQYIRAIREILKIDDGAVYKDCRYSLLHKIISDATYSSTPLERYTRPEFFWSVNAINTLLDLDKKMHLEQLGEEFQVELPEKPGSILRKEHVVPTSVVIKYLLNLAEPSDERVKHAFECARVVCVITRAENSQLSKKDMPGEMVFMEDNWSGEDNWARYRQPKFGEAITVSDFSCQRVGGGRTLKFTRRHR